MTMLAAIVVFGLCFGIVSAKPRLVQSEDVIAVFRTSRISVDDKETNDNQVDPIVTFDNVDATAANEHNDDTQLTYLFDDAKIKDQQDDPQPAGLIGDGQATDLSAVDELMKALVNEAVIDSTGYYDKGIRLNDSQCSCQQYTCSCCYQFTKIKLQGDACLSITYLVGQWAVQVSLTYNGHVIINQRIDGKYPPPLCAKFQQASICLSFDNFDFQDKHFSGCASLKVTVFQVVIYDNKLGCFQIPPNRAIQA